MPIKRINYQVPNVLLLNEPDAGGRGQDFAGVVAVDAEYFIGIQRLSQHLGEILALNTKTSYLTSYLNCFGPLEVDDLCDAILKGDMEAFDASLAEAPQAATTDVLVFNNSWQLDKYGPLNLTPVEVDSYTLNPLWLALLCAQPAMVKKLLPRYTTRLRDLMIADKDFYQIAIRIMHEIFADLLALDFEIIITKLFYCLKQLNNRDEYSKELKKFPCPLNEKQVATLIFSLPNYTRMEFSYYSNYPEFFAWLLHSGLDFNAPINDQGETLAFVLCQKSEFLYLLEQLLAKGAVIDLTRTNIDGKICFDFVSNQDLFSSPCLDKILTNSALLSKCSLTKDDSTILHTLASLDFWSLFERFYKAKPTLITVKNATGHLPLEEASSIRHAPFYKAMLLIKNAYPGVFLEIALKKKIVPHVFVESSDSTFWQPDLANKPKLLEQAMHNLAEFLAQHQLRDCVAALDPPLALALQNMSAKRRSSSRFSLARFVPS